MVVVVVVGCMLFAHFLLMLTGCDGGDGGGRAYDVCTFSVDVDG